MKTTVFLSAWLLLWGAEGIAMDIVAHRGASADAPENTLLAIELGFARGADAAECDVHLTADGRIVAIHDADTLRTTGQRLVVADSKWDQLAGLDAGGWKAERFKGERIPLLSSLLDAIPAGKRLLIEVKCGPEVLDGLGKLIAGSGRADRVWIISFDLEVVAGAKRLLPKVPALYLKKSPKDLAGSYRPHDPGLVNTATAKGLDGLGLHHAGVTAEIVTAAHRAGLKVYVWTVDDPAEARRLESLGIDGLITNRPGWMRTQLDLKERAR